MIEYRYELQCNGQEFRVVRHGTETQRGHVHYHAPEAIGYPSAGLEQALTSAARQAGTGFKIGLEVWKQ